MAFANHTSQIFHTEGTKQLRMKLITQGTKPLLGFSAFYARNGQWFPGRKHFFMPLEAWKEMMLHVPSFHEKAMKGIYSNYIYHRLSNCT